MPRSTPAEATPWRALIAAANRSGIGPADFWRLSLREWRALIAASADAALSRQDFEALAQLYPDQIDDPY
jgi:uncharacterized phage protein (TIGR02216 family)